LGKKFITELSILDDKEVEAIHGASLRILREIGVKIPDNEVLKLLEENGADINWHSRVAKIPEPLVQKALDGVKKDFRKATAYFGQHPELGRGEFILWMCREPEVIDLERNEKRRGTHDDMIRGITVGNVLENVGVIEPHGIPGEVPPDIVDVYCYRYLYAFSKKPCSTWIYSANSARYIIEMAKIIDSYTENELESILKKAIISRAKN